MDRYSAIVATALLSILVLAYAVVIEGQLFFGLVSVAVICAVSFLARRGDREHATVVGVLGGLLSAAFLLGRLEIILPVFVVAGFAYLGWSIRRHRPTA
ncbi:hypothetical protein [Halomarina litorea]|uniref:hypothetical protein n=1 Tax=Halomarina litorea TaxID=2961595 RepID=UPI0020C4B0D9|nr:hypothetical protein [Halomarina sp. BCD28]